MVFWLVGLGLGDEEDITLRGLNVVRKCETVYLEAYTSILTVGRERLEVPRIWPRHAVRRPRPWKSQSRSI